MPFSARAIVLLLVAWIAACGGSAPPPKSGDFALGTTDKDAGANATSTERSPDEEAAVPVSADDPTRGRRDALVTIVLFSDFQCPFCSRLVPTMDALHETYGDDLRLVFKHEPLAFHAHARVAAEVAHGVFATRGPEAFWRFHDMAFRRQQAIDPDAIRAWAIAAGADAREIEDGLSHHTWSPKIERDEALAKRLDALGTPTAFVNGVRMAGAQPLDKFKSVVDAELAKAKVLAASGVARDLVYARMVTANYRDPKQRPGSDDDDGEDAKDAATVWKVPVGTSPVRGSNAALVTMVVFSEFQCPFCKKVQPTIEQLRKDYGDRLRVVWKDEPLPFHPRAVPAANLARAARAQKGDAAFWNVHDKLFESQPKLEDDDLEAVARAANLDVAKAMAAVKAKSFAAGIAVDESIADDVMASGTPHFFINGRRLVGAHPPEKFKAIIDEEMLKAEALVKSGVAKTAVYATIMKGASSGPEPERTSVTVTSAASAPFRGAANAKVVIQEFSDLQCPYCSRAEPTVDELLKAYPGKVKVVWRNLPLPMHPDAALAAEAAREAFVQKGNVGFSKMRELLFAHQADHDGLKRPALEGYASTVGLDAAKFGKALDDRTHHAAVEADMKSASDAGITGTPTFVVGPYVLSGAQPLRKFKKVVDRVLAEPARPAPPVEPVVPVAAPSGGATTLLPTAAAPAGATTRLPGGLVVQDVTVGSGPAAKSGDTVSVHYVGTLTDGKEFDSSRKHMQPFSFEVGRGQVIKGWDAGVVGMKVGGRRKLTIPPDLAYGDRGFPGNIPPRSTLLFDIELLSIK